MRRRKEEERERLGQEEEVALWRGFVEKLRYRGAVGVKLGGQRRIRYVEC